MRIFKARATWIFTWFQLWAGNPLRHFKNYAYSSWLCGVLRWFCFSVFHPYPLGLLDWHWDNQMTPMPRTITSEAPDRNQRISRPTCHNQTLFDELSKCLFSSRWLNICLHRSHPSQVAAHPGGRLQEGLPRFKFDGKFHCISITGYDITATCCTCQDITAAVSWMKFGSLESGSERNEFSITFQLW